MTKEELDIILENHKHYIAEDCVGWEGMRANLRNADLRGIFLCGTDLRGALLCGTDLRNSSLRNSSLRNASLCGALLCGTDLCGTDMSNTDLRNSSLRNASLCGTDMRNTDMRNTDLSNADLRGAFLCRADLRGAKNIPYIPMVCPEEGMCIGWKKAYNKIIKLEIPADAKRSSATSRKCRCSKAKVLAIYELDGTESNIKEIASSYNKNFIYKVGEVVEVEDFDEDRWNECSTGIHFFINRQEAINY